jgi:hypothetical protein
VTYTVVAPLVLAADQGGQTHHVYAGGVIDWLSDQQKAYFLAEGLVTAGDDASADGGDKPQPAATKAELIAWLVDHAVRPDGSEYTAGALQPMNKDELRELIDAVD